MPTNKNKKRPIHSFRNAESSDSTPVFRKADLKSTLGFLTAIFAFLLYVNTLNHGYVLDDFPTIKGNALTQKGFEGIPTLLRTAYWYGLDGQNDWLYRPLSMVMFAVEWELFPDNPFPGHLINVLLYAVTGYVLFFLLCRLLKNQNVLIPFLTSLLFIAHPIHTEVVANIKSRDEILWCLLGFLSLLYLFDYIETKSILKLMLSVAVFFSALFAKESAVTFVVTFPLAAWFFTGINQQGRAVSGSAKVTSLNYKELILTCIGYVAAVVVYLFIRGSVLTSQTGDPHISAIDNSLITAPDITSRFATAFSILGDYIKLLIFPHPLAYDYSYPQIKIVSFSNPWALLSLACYVTMGVYALIKFLKKDIISFSILWYLVPVGLVANLFFLTRSTMAERFLYVSSLGFCLVVATLLAKWFKAETVKQNFDNLSSLFKRNQNLFLVTCIVLALYSFKTIDRNKDWQSDTTLFSGDLAVVPRSARAQFLCANHYLQSLNQGIVAPGKMEQYWSDAIKGFKKAVELYPGYYDAWFGLGEAYSYKKDYRNSVAYYKHAVELSPAALTALNNLGNDYGRIGMADSALYYLHKTLELNPDYADAYNNIGAVYFAQNKFEKAIDAYLKAVTLNPEYGDALRNLASSYGMMKDYDNAIRYFEKAAEVNPNNADTYQYLGMTWQFKGDSLKAKSYLEHANRLRNEKK